MVKDEQSHKLAEATPASGHRGRTRLELDGRTADREGRGAGEGGGMSATGTEAQ